MKRNWKKRGMAMMLAALMCCMCAAPAAASAEAGYAEETALRDDSAKRKVVFELYDEKDRKRMNQSFGCFENVEMIVLADGTKSIRSGAFAKLDSLKKVVIPSSVSKIEPGAFGSNTRQPVIYTEKDSYAYQHAQRYTIQTETEKQFCLQSEGGEAAVVQADLTADFETGVSLQATVTTDKAQMGGLADGFEEAAALYKMALVKDGEKIQTTEKMYVYLALPDEINGTYADYYSVGEDGSLTELVSYTDPYTPQQAKTIEMNGISDVLVITGHKTGDVAGDFVVEDGVLKSYECSDPIVVVPEGVEKIASGVFYHEYYTSENKILENVKHVVLPEGLKEIEMLAFVRYSLESVVIPDSIEVIADDAFAYPPDPPIYPPLDQSGTMPIKIYGKTLTVAESYATENKDRFIPTNTQLRGDVNGSGDFEAADALGILRMVVDLEPKYGYSADADEDGSVTAADALHVLRIVVGLSSAPDRRMEATRAYLEFMDNHLIMQRDANGEIVREEDGTKYCRFEEKCEKEETPCRFANMENAPVDVVINDVTVFDYDCDGEAEVFLFDTKKTNRIYICRKDRTQEGAYSWDEPLSPAVYYRNGIAFTNGTSIWRASYYWENPDEKIISTVSEEDDFLPGEVVIVMKREYSASNKRYSPEDFPGVDIEEIEYLTSLKENPDGSLIDIWDFRQILRLKLRDESRQGVLDAIAVLNENQSVRSADPNYLIYPCED